MPFYDRSSNFILTLQFHLGEKSTLLSQLHNNRQIPQHWQASHSPGFPSQELHKPTQCWDTDCKTWTALFIKKIIRMVYLATSAIWESFMLRSLFLSSSSSSMMSNTLSTPCRQKLNTFQKTEMLKNEPFLHICRWGPLWNGATVSDSCPCSTFPGRKSLLPM